MRYSILRDEGFKLNKTIHSHLDTWRPSVFGGAPSAQAAINHGTYFYWASQEGLIKNGTSIASIFAPFLLATITLILVRYF